MRLSSTLPGWCSADFWHSVPVQLCYETSALVKKRTCLHDYFNQSYSFHPSCNYMGLWIFWWKDISRSTEKQQNAFQLSFHAEPWRSLLSAVSLRLYINQKPGQRIVAGFLYTVYGGGRNLDKVHHRKGVQSDNSGLDLITLINKSGSAAIIQQ